MHDISSDREQTIMSLRDVFIMAVVSLPELQQHSLQPLTHWAVRHLPPSHMSSPHTPLLCTCDLRDDVETLARASHSLSSRERFSPWTCCMWSIWKCSVRQEFFAVSRLWGRFWWVHCCLYQYVIIVVLEQKVISWKSQML